MKNLVIYILMITFLITGCQKEKQIIENTNLKLGTIVSIKIFNSNDEKLIPNINNIIDNIENKMSRNIKESELNKINDLKANEELNISNDTKNVISKGLYYSNLSKGNFDISIEPLVSLWGIGTESEKIPTDNEISDVITKINYNSIKLKDNTISKSNDFTSLDLGGIAKGYAADEIKSFLLKNGVDKALISLGGNVQAVGSNLEDKPWKVGIKNPLSQESSIVGYVKVIDKSVVTSGIYERFFIKNDKRYHHILDPHTGYPYNNEIYGVTIISDNSIDGDALSTITFSYGIKKGLKFINNLDNTEAIFISKDKEIYLSNNISENFTLMNNSFIIK